VKLHTLLDLRGDIPTFIWVTDGKVHDVNVLDHLIPEPGSIYIMDRAYLDFQRLYQMHQSSAIFVIRSKTNTGLRRIYSSKVDKGTGVRCDQTVVPTGFYSKKDFPGKLRRIKYYDSEKGRSFVFLTNQFLLPANTIAELYRYRWRVEIFFKWIKQHLRIKKFFGTSENAVKSQIWIAISTYVLIAIMKKRLHIDLTLYTILQILSISLFEKKMIYQVLTDVDYKNGSADTHIQLKLFES
jgi:IS4 transposase